MPDLLARAAIILAVTALGVILALLVPSHLIYAEPATSFDQVFDRLGLVAAAGFVAGFGGGVGAASLLGRRRMDRTTRWARTVLAVLLALAAMGAVLLVMLATG